MATESGFPWERIEYPSETPFGWRGDSLTIVRVRDLDGPSKDDAAGFPLFLSPTPHEVSRGSSVPA